MKPRTTWLATSIAIGAAGWAALANASGFHIDEQDARATGRAGAITASTNNPSAIYYNPAGLAELGGVHVQVGASVVAPEAAFQGVDGGAEVRVEERQFVLPQLYASAKMGSWFALGLGLYAPYGLALRWPQNSPGRTVVSEADLQAPFITPAVAFDLSAWVPGLAWGGGLDLVPASVVLKRDVAFGTDFGSVALGGNAFGLGARAGLLYRSPSWPLSFGVTWRSPVTLDFTGNADFDAPANYRAALPPDGDVSTQLVLPASVGIGIGVRPLASWELEVDVNWRGWSSYDELDIRLPGGERSLSRRDWEDSLTIRVGTEFSFAPGWAARLGLAWDETPIPADTLDFQLPDASRFDVAAGLGGEVFSGLRVDLGGLYVLPTRRRNESSDPLEPLVPGRFEIAAWVLSLSISARFGATDHLADPYALAAPLGTPTR